MELRQLRSLVALVESGFNVTQAASQFRTNMIGLYMAVMAVVLALVIFLLFPERTNTGNGLVWEPPIRIVRIFLPQLVLEAETRLLLLVMAMGALGSYVHAATSFVSYVGNRSFVESWT